MSRKRAAGKADRNVRTRSAGKMPRGNAPPPLAKSSCAKSGVASGFPNVMPHVIKSGTLDVRAQPWRRHSVEACQSP